MKAAVTSGEHDNLEETSAQEADVHGPYFAPRDVKIRVVAGFAEALCREEVWLRGLDLNQRPSGY